MISLATSSVLLQRPTAPVARLDQPVTTVCLYASMVSGAINGAAPVAAFPPAVLSADAAILLLTDSPNVATEEETSEKTPAS